jgi:hypothetical protein
MANKSFFNPKGSFAMGLAGSIGAWEPELMKYAFKDILTRKMYGKSLKDLTKEQLEREQEGYLRDKLLKEASIKEKEAQAEYYQKRAEELGKPKVDPYEDLKKDKLLKEIELIEAKIKNIGKGGYKPSLSMQDRLALEDLKHAYLLLSKGTSDEKKEAEKIIKNYKKKYGINIGVDDNKDNSSFDNINFDLFNVKSNNFGKKISPLDKFGY